MSSLDRIDDRYEDVNFEDELGYGKGSLDVPYFEELLMGSYEDQSAVLSDQELREAADQQEEHGGMEELVTRVFNQRQEGSCVGNASCAGNQIIQAKQFGTDRVVQLSAISLYKQIGRSPGSGATVSSGLRAMQSVGVLPLDTAENRQEYGDHVMPNTGFHRPFPDDWKETAAKFKTVEAHVIQTMQGLFSALARQEPVIVGREGHSICYVRLLWDNGWKVVYVNSWGNWGFGYGKFDSGFGIDTRSKIQKSSRWAFVLRTVEGRGGT